MEIGTLLGDAYEYTRDALWGRWTRWLILLVGSIIFPIILGYTLLVYRGESTPPDPQDWVTVFVDGIKLFIVQLVYAIPIVLINLVLNLLLLAPVLAVNSQDGTADGAVSGAVIAAAMLAFVVMVVVSILISLISTIAAVRFSRTDSFGGAFNFSAILAHIGRIGWGSYVLALIVLYVVIVAVVAVVVALTLLGVLTLGVGFLLLFALAPAFSIFVARYVTLIYDSAPAPA